MSDEKPVEAAEVERGDVSSGGHEKGTIEYERSQLLAGLPDPDAGKSDEERAAIVSSTPSPLPRHNTTHNRSPHTKRSPPIHEAAKGTRQTANKRPPP